MAKESFCNFCGSSAVGPDGCEYCRSFTPPAPDLAAVDRQMAIDDGGAAFPRTATSFPNGEPDWGSDGMTLRDWFAGQAMASVLGTTGRCSDTIAGIVRAAYLTADVMIAHRKGGR